MAKKTWLKRDLWMSRVRVLIQSSFVRYSKPKPPEVSGSSASPVKLMPIFQIELKCQTLLISKIWFFILILETWILVIKSKLATCIAVDGNFMKQGNVHKVGIQLSWWNTRLGPCNRVIQSPCTQWHFALSFSLLQLSMLLSLGKQMLGWNYNCFKLAKVVYRSEVVWYM